MSDPASITAFFIYAFTSIFIIVNPLGGVLTFMSITRDMNDQEKKDTAKRSVTIACVIAIVMAITGELILRLFGINADTLRIAGGVLLFAVAFDMLHARPSRESVTPEEIKDAAKREDISVFPIAIPLLTGPGAITTVIVLMRTGHGPGLKAATITAILLTFVLAYIIFVNAHQINRMLGVTITLVINRLMGLFLGAIAVNFIVVGLWNIYRSFR